MGIHGGMVYILSLSWSNHSTAHSLSSLVYAESGDIGKTHQYFLNWMKQIYIHLQKIFFIMFLKNVNKEVYLNFSTKEPISQNRFICSNIKIPECTFSTHFFAFGSKYPLQFRTFIVRFL